MYENGKRSTAIYERLGTEEEITKRANGYEFIQAELYKNSLNKSKRNTGILYYNCTNYFFELEE